MKKIFLFISISTLISCSSAKKKSESNYKTHPLLISCETELIENNEGQDTRYVNGKHLLYHMHYGGHSQSDNDTMFVYTIKEDNGCKDLIGDIKIQADTLFLLNVNSNENGCKESNFYKFTYAILNPEHKEYVIVY